MRCFNIVLINLFLFSHLYSQNVIKGEPPENEIIYKCSPCGCINDGDVFDSAGNCPSCHMSLQASMVGVESQIPAPRSLRAGILLFDHADIMDVTGPWSVLVHNHISVLTFAKTKEPVSLGMSMELMPDYTLDDMPEVDILIFPGGGMAESNPGDKEIIEFIQERSKSTDVILSVCSGAFFLAESGILDGKEATTFAGLIPLLESSYPKIKVRNDVKYVDNGKIVTTAGLSSGIDGTFYAISKFRGEGAVQDVANHMEYPWSRSTEYARSQLADNYILEIKTLASLFSKEYISSNGNRNSWEYKYSLSDELKSSKVLYLINKELQKSRNWKQQKLTSKYLLGTISDNVIGDAKIELEVHKVEDNEILSIKATRVKQLEITSKAHETL